MARYVEKPTVEKMFSGNNDLRHIPEGVIVTNSAENINANGTFERTVPITKEDIGYTTTDGKGPFRTTAGATYDITGSLANRTTTTHGDTEIFSDTPRVGNSAIEVIPRATTTIPGIVIIGDNLTVDSNGRISAQNSYVHPPTHPGSMITEDATHRWTTDAEKAKWNGKADANHSHSWDSITGKPSTFTPSAHNHDGVYAPVSHTHNIVKDIGDNTDTTFAYSKAGLNYGEFTWLAGWNGRELRAVNKSLFLPTTGGTINGALTVTGQILSNADVVAFSDARFKTNLSVIDNPLSKLNEIFGYYYDMQGLDENRKHQVGLIAQEVAKILPEAIYTDNNGYLGIRYTNIIPLLVEAVKELSERLNAISR